MLVDTAGRLHTRVNLMNELDKIRRIAAREVAGAPHEVLLVLDATVGQNGLDAGPRVHERRRRERHRADETRRHREGRRRRRDRERSETADSLRRRRRRASTISSRFRPRNTSTGSSKRSGDVTDADYMARALFHAARGRGRTSPNPGRRRGRRVAGRRRRGRGLSRARRRAARRSERARRWPAEEARGATLYCSLEPCCHTGRTGPCVARIVDAGIARVVAAGRGSEPARARPRLRLPASRAASPSTSASGARRPCCSTSRSSR